MNRCFYMWLKVVVGIGVVLFLVYKYCGVCIFQKVYVVENKNE